MKLSCLLLLQSLFLWSVNATKSISPCQRKCGNVTIPYPFGTQEGCYLDKSYYIECDSETQVSRLNKAFSFVVSEGIMREPVEVIELNVDGHLTVNLPFVHACYSNLGRLHYGSPQQYHMSRFPFSSSLNKFVGVGPQIEAHIEFAAPIVTTTCQTNLFNFTGSLNGTCLGFECCFTDIIPGNMTYAHIAVKNTKSYTKVKDYKQCGYAFIVENDKFDFRYDHLDILMVKRSFPVVLEWSVGNSSCEEARRDNVTYMCQENSVCVDGEDKFPGYRCVCSRGFEGNAYVKNGCQDVNECESPELNDCLDGQCENTNGSFACVCPKGQQGNAKRGTQCAPGDGSDHRSIVKGVSKAVAGTVLIMVFVYLGIMRRRKFKVRNELFKKNGGIMLQKMLFSSKDTAQKAKIFTEEELNKATDNFDNANVIGQGGYGTVYKGILPNKTLVAIKKSNVIDQTQVKQFVNEVIILSKICHPNIVKLLGCCLETHVPLLVYEYVVNNTLCHHIQTHPMLTLQKRIKICEDTAEALSYMHSTIQIIHRDVKPSNILLDDSFSAKVSDFGISTFVPPGQTHLSTFVKGTIGYLDPEYFRTSKLTDKSDVYSFGVVLTELLMGRDIHSLGISLTNYTGPAAYLVSLLEQNVLVHVLDEQMKTEEHTEVVKCVAKIAISCLNLEGKRSPTMEEIKQELKRLRFFLLSGEC